MRRVVQADLNLQPRSSACWTAQLLLSAFQGLRGRELYVRAVQTGRAIPMQEFTADLKHRMRGVWRDAELVDHITHNNKLATYHSWFAIPFSRNERMPINNVPRYLHLDLSKHVVRNISRFRLRAHTLKVAAAAWLEDGSCVCDQCPCILVKMNMFRTRCMLFYFAKTIEFMSWGNIFLFYLRFFWGKKRSYAGSESHSSH